MISRPLRRTPCPRDRRGSLAALAGLALAGVLAACGAPSATATRPGSRPAHVLSSNGARVGIVNAMGMEQAPILAAMRVTGVRVIDGYRFYLGTIAGRPVVDVRSGEKEYAAELATAVMDATFHPVASVLTGTAGARNPAVNVGDVVVSGFVVDKSSIHFHDRGFISPYTGVEMVVTHRSDVAGGLVGGFGAPGPTPADASRYGSGPAATTNRYEYFEALASPRSLVRLAERYRLGTTPRSVATGSSTATGTIPAVVDAGVIGSANQWTEPLADQELQNSLYQSDAGENEGMGFAYTNAQLGVPWLVVRGISDSPWYPSAYSGVLAANRAAAVGIYVVQHMPPHVVRTPSTLATLSPSSNAARAGYVVANRVDVTAAGAVTEVTYTAGTGGSVTEKWPFASEYTFAAGTAGASARTATSALVKPSS
ncbi:MAG: 5'-methylthioadenosine/S-adenosylhomocysteine nucleosidase [Actinomycetota bacterium]|nr:5'-methylthioadenosine/S-adenosylhomocysteine nucleosidase [Actinomycetota bacterium]